MEIDIRNSKLVPLANLLKLLKKYKINLNKSQTKVPSHEHIHFAPSSRAANMQLIHVGPNTPSSAFKRLTSAVTLLKKKKMLFFF